MNKPFGERTPDDAPEDRMAAAVEMMDGIRADDANLAPHEYMGLDGKEDD